jgi:hypothetical protein
MKSRNRLIFSVCLALLSGTCLSAPSPAQKGDVAALSAKIRELGRAGKYAEAVALAQGQVESLEKRFGPAHRDVDFDLRPAQGRSQARPRRGAASGHAGLPQRCVLAPQRLSGVLGAVCTGWGGGCALTFSIVRRSNFRSGQAATDGRATTTAKQRKAPQQAIDADQPPSLE